MDDNEDALLAEMMKLYVAKKANMVETDESTAPLTKKKPIKQVEQVPATPVNTPVPDKKKRKITVPKSQAQMDAFKKVQEARKANIEAKKKQKLLDSAQLLLQNQQQTQSVQKKPVKKPKPEVIDDEYEADEEMVIEFQKKPKKKAQKKIIIYDSDSSDEEPYEKPSRKPEYEPSKPMVMRENKYWPLDDCYF